MKRKADRYALLNTAFTFRAKIIKVGINACVSVPLRITRKLIVKKGYIPVKGTIDGSPFKQTLCPIKDSRYRLYVNKMMLTASHKNVGDAAAFIVSQDDQPKTTAPPMLKEFKRRLAAESLVKSYESLIPSAQKEILKYMSRLKTRASRDRNIEKVISELSQNRKTL